MFVRVLKMEAKPGKAKALCSLINEKGLPILRKLPGFIDGFYVIPEGVGGEVIAMSFWETKEAADKYRKESYRDIEQLYEPYVDGIIQVRRGTAAGSTVWGKKPVKVA
jgi:heme-degrading monooxygenase HmoA